MSDLLAIRSSSLPRAALCPASVQKPGIKIDGPSEAAHIGTAVHKVMERWITKGKNAEDIEQAATDYKADPDEVAILSYLAWRSWEQMAPHFPGATCEQEAKMVMDGILLTGHPDADSLVGDQVRIADFKTGRADMDYSDQLRGYCWLGLQKHPQATSAYGVIVWVRDGTVEGYKWSRRDLQHWWETLAHRLKTEQETYNPGAACGYCQRAHECEARKKYLQRISEEMMVAQEGGFDLHLMTPQEQGTILAAGIIRCRQLEAATESFRAMAKAHVQACGGHLPGLAGQELVIEQSKTRKLDYRLSLPVLRDYVSQQEIDQAVTLGVTKATAAIRANAPDGQKGHRVDEVFGRLENAGAISYKVEETLKVVRSVAQVEDKTDAVPDVRSHA